MEVTSGTKEFGSWLRERRRELDLTQEELANRVGCSPYAISKIELGQRRPSRQVADLIAEALGLPPDERSNVVRWARASYEADKSQLVNPYKGLQAFDEADAPYFFGREALTQRLLSRLSEPGPFCHFLAVVGPSGSGKSSVVRAGLVPTIRQLGLPRGSRLAVVDMVPGTHPMEKLAAALQRVAVNPPLTLLEQLHAGPRGLFMVAKRVLPVLPVLPAPGDTGVCAGLLLFIDQFEELFTLVHDDAARQALLDNLYTAAMEPHSPVWIVVTLRADFYDRPLVYGNWCELLRQRTELVGPMSANESHQAIVGPAERAGVVLESELVSAMQRDVGDQPGTLPLMEYALTELFEQREGHVLTLAAYRASGGVHGALGRRAEEIYMGLDPAGQEETRRLFQRLVMLGKGVEDTRRRVSRSELASASLDEEALDRVLEVFGRYRLLTFDRDPVTHGPTVEMAHEALLKSWDRLRDWLDSSRSELRTQRQLMLAASEWASGGRDPSFLAGGARLAQFEGLTEGTDRPGGVALTAEEKEYLVASEKERERALLAQERLRRRVTTGLAVGLVLTLVLAALTVVQSIQANEQRNVALAQANARAAVQAEAETRGAEAFSRELAARSVNEYALNPNLSLLLAIEAVEASQTDDAEQALRRAVIATQPHTELRPADKDEVISAVFSPDGQQVATTGKTITRVWEVNDRTDASGNIVAELDTPKGPGVRSARSVAFSPDGKRLVVGSDDGIARVWDIAQQSILAQLEGHTNVITSVAFNSDGKRVATGSNDNTVRVWDASTGMMLVELDGHTARVTGVAFSPDGNSVVASSADATAMVWDAISGRAVLTLTGHTGPVNSVVFSPEGKRIVTAGNDKTARVWDANMGKPLLTIVGHADSINSAAFSADGKLVVTGSDDKTARVWDANTGQQLAVMDAGLVTSPSGNDAKGQSPILQVSFSPDSKRVLMVTDGTDDAAWIYPWNLFTPLSQLMHIAVMLPPRQLTCEERQTYLHENNACGTPTAQPKP